MQKGHPKIKNCITLHCISVSVKTFFFWTSEVTVLSSSIFCNIINKAREPDTGMKLFEMLDAVNLVAIKMNENSIQLKSYLDSRLEGKP